MAAAACSKAFERVRIAIPIQKSLVKRAAGFLFGKPVDYKITQNGESVKTASEEQKRLFEAVKRVYHQNKMKYFDKH